ncbi:MAG TPA: Fic family protein [Candidatus Baltobacteraceae bacterium]|jgi:Fic family protein|nr:Fic family protein [Candidatus Baltobacteraceae bacterium]
MENVDNLKERLDALRPLSRENVDRLWPMWENDDVLHVYATNAIEGSSMDLGETLAVLTDGITIGGKKLSEYFDIVHGQRAYKLMLKLAKDQARVTTTVIRGLHRVVVGSDEDFAGQWRDHPVYISGSLHVPPNYIKVPDLMDEMIAAYDTSKTTDHPVVTAAKLHFNLVRVHPFADGNGRTARLLGNLELIRMGFAPILIEKEDRKTYFNILERCCMGGEPGKGDPTEFVAFVERFEEKALDRYLRALEVSHGIPFDQGSRQVNRTPSGEPSEDGSTKLRIKL